jgi:hypothetical protein
MKRIFVSHPFADNPEVNRKIVDSICKELVKDGYLPISPIHLFGFMENDDNRSDILKVCSDLINLCDEVWVYGWSEGCNLEAGIAEMIGKPVKRFYDDVR